MLFGWFATTWMTGAFVQAAGVPQDVEVRGSGESTSDKLNLSESEKRPAKHGTSSVEEEPSFTAQHDWRRWGADFLQDQKEIWTSPAKLQFSDTQWLVPIAGVTAGLMQTDAQYSRHLSHNPSTLSTYNNLSNATAAVLLGGAGGMWLLSYQNHNQHWRETGFLAGEAAVNSLVVVEAMKYAAQRDRPNQDFGQGQFFQKGGTSFPSEHAAAAWAVAGVIAHEYPGPIPKLLAYGLASVVSFSRIRARQHFPSDVFIGGIVGDMIGQQTFSRHHDPELGGEFWNSLSHTFRSESASQPGNQGSPYVPLDSWVYPIFDRLKAMGYVNTGVVGQRPWTRLECARLLTEASSAVEGPMQGKLAEGPEVRGLLNALQREFSSDVELLADGGWNTGAHVESVYTRFTEVAGKPLTDSEHFGETLTNDFGRPYQEGLNNVTGFSGWATAGRWVAYVRGEYQTAPAGPGYSGPVRNFIAQADNTPVQPATSIAATSQFQLLDAYVGLNFSNWQLTFGQQSLDWGPSRMGSLNFSDNAAPIRMIQLNRTVPLVLPWIFRYLGPMRVDLFFGNMDGHQFPPGPIFHGEKISVMPLPNLEFGFSRTVVMGGLGRPLTLRSVWNSYTSVSTSETENPATDPGKRTGGFDVSYRIPLPRYPLTFYVDSLADDNTSPLADVRRAGVNTGLYIPQIPGLNKLDLRMEAAYTDVPYPEQAGKFIYYDGFYHDLYTNKGQLVGNTAGRDGKVYQAWSRYWIGARTHIELGYRHAQVSANFVPGGGTINDASVSADLLLHQVWNLSTSVQYEEWNYPILAHGPQQNVTVSIGMSFLPPWGKRQTSPVPISMTHTSRSVGEPVQ